MPRFIRPLVAGLVASSLLACIGPAVAEGHSPGARGGTDPIEVGLPADVQLPVPVRDVTDSDSDLRGTRNEVTVLVSHGTDSPTVTKLRADSATAAAALADALDDEPGMVAAPTSRLRAFSIPPEPLSQQQWNLAMVRATPAWEVSRGAHVVVAVIDTGVDRSHPDLVGRVLTEIDLLPEVAPLPEQNGHGTRVASIIAAAINGIGMAGVAPQASILPVSALDPQGFGDSSTVARAIIRAADAGARVINLSLGGPDRDPILDQACSYAFHKGAVVVAAGGNSSLAGNQVQYPAASPHVVAVSSVNDSGDHSAFSNSGSHIDLAAPGESILAAIPASGGQGAGYNRESGTSFSAPHVAGTVALMLAANPDLSADAAATMVRLTALDDRSRNGRDRQLGWGLLQADRAVQIARLLARSNLGPQPRLKLARLNARPEPGHKGQVSTFATRVRAQRPDGTWRNSPFPSAVRIEFKARGTSRYHFFAKIASGARGRAVLKAIPPRSGRWRARVKQPWGKWTASDADYLRVLR